MFLFIYALVLLCMCITQIKTIKAVNYIRYIYCLFIFLLVIFKYKKLSLNKTIIVVLVFFLLHTLIFGFLLPPENLKSTVYDNGKEMLMFWVFVFFTATYVREERVEKYFLIITQIVISVFLLYCYLTNFTGIAPLKFIVNMFSDDLQRVRFKVGFESYNAAAFFGLSSFMISFIVSTVYFRLNTISNIYLFLYKLYLYVSEAVAILVILSAQTRMALLLIFVFLFLGFIAVNKNFQRKKRMIWIVYFIALGALYALAFYYLFFYGDSRSSYLTTNLEIYWENANKFVGMGYAPFSAFLTKSFGYETGPMDSYFLYILCSTGIIGLILILIPILIILIQYFIMFFSKNTTIFQNIVFVLFIVVLIESLSESNFIYSFNAYINVYWIFFFLAIMGKKQGINEGIDG